MTLDARQMLLATAALAFAPSAFAAGGPYASDPADIKFAGVQNVINTTYEIPIGFDIDVIIAQFWIGVSVKLVGNQQFGVQVEGTSDISWGGPDQREGVLYQSIVPIDGSGAAAMQSDVRFNITFDVWRDSYGSSSGRLINFPLFAQGIQFKVDAEPFTPFMLPGQQPGSQLLQTRSQDLAFVRDFEVPIGIGVVTLTPGVRLTGYPVAFAQFAGVDLETTWVEGNVVISQGLDYPGEIELYEPLPSIELTSAYGAMVDSSINYVIKADFIIELDILGIFTLPFQINLVDYTIPLFQGGGEFDFETASYVHPLPMFEEPIDKVQFGPVDTGKTESYSYLFNNSGLLDLTGVVSIRGDAAFAASPNQVGAAGGGQDSIVITFSPEDAGEYSATLVLETNDPYQPTHEVRITGKGVTPETPIDEPGDNDGYTGQTPGTIYQTCGCASTTGASGLLPLAAMLPLLALRRRQRKA